MAVLKGNSGDIQWDSNDVEQMQDWSLDISVDKLEDTEFGDSWVSYTTGILSWTGSAKGNFDSSDTNGHVALKTAVLAPSTATVKFEISGSNYFSGTAIVEASISVNTKGLVEVNYNFTGVGTLSYS